ncbi:MAG: MFS transporter [Butyrivibrio sp.]|uniref:MFS transporter n=1 Tax=Butyrivibrio sp. TaxID=28121 RepID=UPI001B11EA6D|nr:MFS transporter [Butyrivibrio sp.]MBO6241765.1 MFS transporter [Butyrivibrio sp.]
MRVENDIRLWNRQFVVLLLINLAGSFSFYMIATTLSKYLVSIGISITFAGVIVGLFSLTSLICRPISGVIADRVNNKKLLRISYFLMCVGLLGFAITTNSQMLILFRILNGIGFAFSGTCQMSMAARMIPKKRMGEGIGYIGLGMVIGSAVAPGVGLVLSETIGMKGTFLIAAGLTLLAVALSYILDEQEKKCTLRKVKFTDIIAPEAIPYTYVAGMFSFANGVIASYLVMFTDELGIKGISAYYSVYAVVLFITRPLSGKLMDKKGICYTVIPGLFLGTISMFLLGSSTTYISILITAAIRAIGQGAAQPSLQAGCVAKLGKDRSGVATSTFYLGGDICQGIGPIIGGAIIGAFVGIKGYSLIFYFCGFLLVAATGYFIVYSFNGRTKSQNQKNRTCF